MGQATVTRAERPPMKIGENQLIATIDPHNRFPETAGKDNRVIHTIDDFLVEDIRHILRNKGWNVSASIQDIWFNGRERIADLSQPRGIDLRGGPAYIRTDLVTIDWLFENAPIGSGIRKYVRKLTDPANYLQPEQKAFIKNNIRGLKSRYRGQPVVPIADINGSSQALLDQIVLSYGTNYLSNPYNDLYAAVGRIGLRGIPLGTAERLGDGRFRVSINGIAVFVFDSFDFGGDQPLGCWARWNIGPEPVPYVTECVGNRDFRRYRRIKKRGGDFIIQTPVKRYVTIFPPQPFIVNLRR